MKLSDLRPLFALAAIAALGACERHEWEDSKVLFQSHGDHGDHGHADGDHDKGHDEHGDHDEAEAPAKH